MNMVSLGFPNPAMAELMGRALPDIQSSIQHTNLTPRFLQDFFKSWLKLDITQLASILTILGTAAKGISTFRGLSSKIYWWCVRNFTSSISVASNDKLNAEILNWVGLNVLDKRSPRILTAQTEHIQSGGYYQPVRRPGKNVEDENRVPVRYLPSFGSTWFFHKGALILVRLIHADAGYAWRSDTPDAYSSAPIGNEPLLVMCVGLTAKPIKRFIETCRDFAEKQRDTFVSVVGARSAGDSIWWSNKVLKPKRPMHTVHFDEKVKAELVEDIRNYLSWDTREFYRARGIPYRRGYLLHGPPGTGKTSLSLALAGMFGLELYLLHIPSIQSDNHLESIFGSLPPRCFVILEDIDAVGAARMMEDDEEFTTKQSAELKSQQPYVAKTSNCTLSGLLNVLDGVASQEGRILLMTSNVPRQLDKALLRPGRIDKMIFLAEISQDSARRMFIRMFDADDEQDLEGSEKTKEKELDRLALKFAEKIPEDTFTPAQLQGFLLLHRGSATKAFESIDAWVTEQSNKRSKEGEHKKKVAIAKASAKNKAKEFEDAKQEQSRSDQDSGGEDTSRDSPVIKIEELA